MSLLDSGSREGIAYFPTLLLSRVVVKADDKRDLLYSDNLIVPMSKNCHPFRPPRLTSHASRSRYLTPRLADLPSKCDQILQASFSLGDHTLSLTVGSRNLKLI